MPECKGCGAQIEWVETVSGKRMPIDPKPIKVVTVTPDNRYEVKTGYAPHWGTCPAREQFKKGKG